MLSRSYQAGLAVALGSMLLTGCAMGRTDKITVGAIPDDYRTRHPIVVAQKEHTLDVAISTNAAKIDPATAANIAGFASKFDRQHAAHIVVMEPTRAPNSHTVRRLRNDVIAALGTGGVTSNEVVFQSYDASAHGAAAPVRFSFVGVAATANECGKWTEDIVRNPENKNYHDFGCSTQSNLAAMIENPNDLLGPRKMTTVDAIRRGAVIEDYQSGGPQPNSEVGVDF
ncbi:MAG: CpaD family pilus assembly lipoprotein [Pseudomonadota bacterium]